MDMIRFLGSSERMSFGVTCVAGCPYYPVSPDIMSECYSHYIETGFNPIDEYADMVDAVSEAKYFDDGNGWWADRDIDNTQKLFNAEGYWDPKDFFTDCQIQAVLRMLGEMENRRDYYKSYKYRRLQACIYTSNPTIRKKVFSRDGKVCRMCGAEDNLTIDHIIPVRHGGENELDNLQVLCATCNSKKGANYEMV